MRLWGSENTRVMRTHWMAGRLGLDYEAKPIASRTGETQADAFRYLNPKGKIAVPEDEGLVLTERVAGMTYLGDTGGDVAGAIPWEKLAFPAVVEAVERLTA